MCSSDLETVAQHNIQCDLKWGHLHMAIKPRQMRELEEMKEELEVEGNYPGLSLLDKDRKSVV